MDPSWRASAMSLCTFKRWGNEEVETPMSHK